MTSKRAGDLMIPLEQYPHIPHWFTLRQAIAELQNSVIEIEGKQSLPRALLVFDEKYDLLGIVRRRDILRGLEPKFMRTMSHPHRKQLFDVEADPDLTVLTSGRVANAVRELAETPISDVMQPITATVNYDDHITKAIYKMITRDQNLLPVLKDNKVVGVIRSVDVFNEIARIVM
ncbi:MAG: CBS domain-containing protein [candidate division Zixibacteria bacterium]|nr:CBS domain-containing protein [candidate division Zixibacteria bacterium]